MFGYLLSRTSEVKSYICCVRAVIAFTDYIDEVLQEDGDDREPRREGDDGGITFTAKSRRYSA